MSSTYQQLVDRVKRKIGSPRAQADNCTELQRQSDDNADDWARMLRELGTVENVTMIPLDETGEHVRIRWNPEESMS
ncbi:MULTISPECIES: DUF1654 domain-containing protein [unclassified Halomonas]|uniref:DUF1654 domain-containing protein n=1 Tax=unclassified Halomonas TaxID=2609666 RepID=UPI00209CD3D6|nr:MULTISPECIES: DUF1654 domain-containing protein [unclassified Halomonas]MCP1313357.1 DUF1654 domain-containing protein [Halomonas sp. 707D7]MCP1326177.1 DUF1654 domain-containing protein [Halomonas sp. 707D4]